METGQEVRAAIAIPGGMRWVTGHVDRIRPQVDGSTRVDVIGWDGTTYRNCSLESIRVVSQ